MRGHIVPLSKPQQGSGGKVGGKGVKPPGNFWSYLVQNPCFNHSQLSFNPMSI